MHTIEPYYNWRHLYRASEDPQSPLFGYFNSEVHFTDQIFDHVIHPQWDSIGCETLYLKVLFVDYAVGYAIIEFFGEWNDAVHNDIMRIKRDLIDEMLPLGIDKFILIGENILNFHADETDYYDEWLEEVPDGWMAFVNLVEIFAVDFFEIGDDSAVNLCIEAYKIIIQSIRVPAYFLVRKIAWRFLNRAVK